MGSDNVSDSAKPSECTVREAFGRNVSARSANGIVAWECESTERESA
jgi:hypothetical protein